MIQYYLITFVSVLRGRGPKSGGGVAYLLGGHRHAPAIHRGGIGREENVAIWIELDELDE